MTEWAPREAKKEELRQIEECLVQQPEAITFYLERARLMSELGMNEEAKDAYLQILGKDPMNFIAMNNLGTLLFSMGFRSAAKTAYEAVTQRWSHPIAHVNLGNILREDGDLEKAQTHYEAALRLTVNERSKAHQGLAHILTEQGNDAAAEYHRQEGFKDQTVVVLPYRGTSQPVSVLILMSAMGGNVPTHPFMDDRFFLMTIVVAEFFDASQPLPEHQIIFNAIGDAELCKNAFLPALKLAEKTTAPIINHPAKVMVTSRAGNAERMKHIPGLVTPKIMSLPRADVNLEGITRHGFKFPLLLRRLGFHGGAFFEKANNALELALKLDTIQGDEITVIEYIDYRSADGNFRKYRAMMIGGELYPLHLAISSSNWKVHYYSADMEDSAVNRTEDKAFLDDMPKVLGPKVMATLKQIQETHGLDYAGIDFGVNQDGDVVLFETNATMVIVVPGDDPKWNFRRAPVRRIQDAAQNMLLKKLLGPAGADYAKSA